MAALAALAAGAPTAASSPAGSSTANAPTRVRLYRPLWPLMELVIWAGTCWRYAPGGLMGAGPPLGYDWTQIQALAPPAGVEWTRQNIDLLRAAEAEQVDHHRVVWEKAQKKVS